MSPKIVKVTTTENYELIITYERNLTKIFDVKPLLEKGLFRELKDKSLFTNFKIVFDTIEWSNGIDIDPDDLFRDSIEINNKNTTETKRLRFPWKTNLLTKV